MRKFKSTIKNIAIFAIFIASLTVIDRTIYSITGISSYWIDLPIFIGIVLLLDALHKKYATNRVAKKNKFNYEYDRNGMKFTIFSNINIENEANAINGPFDEDEVVLSAVAGAGEYGHNAILICTSKRYFYYDKGYPFLSSYGLGARVEIVFSGTETVNLEEKKFEGSSIVVLGVIEMWPFILNNVPRDAAKEMYYSLQNEIKRATTVKPRKEG